MNERSPTRRLLSRLLLTTGVAASGCKGGPEAPPPAASTAQVPERQPESPSGNSPSATPARPAPAATSTTPAASASGAPLTHGLSMCTGKAPTSAPGTTGGQGDREACIPARSGTCPAATDPSILGDVLRALHAPIVCAAGEATLRKGAGGDECCYPVRFNSKGRPLEVEGQARVAPLASAPAWSLGG